MKERKKKKEMDGWIDITFGVGRILSEEIVWENVFYIQAYSSTSLKRVRGFVLIHYATESPNSNRRWVYMNSITTKMNYGTIQDRASIQFAISLPNNYKLSNKNTYGLYTSFKQ